MSSSLWTDGEGNCQGQRDGWRSVSTHPAPACLRVGCVAHDAGHEQLRSCQAQDGPFVTVDVPFVTVDGPLSRWMGPLS